MRQLAKSIETFGFVVPVLVDSSLKVLAGHARVAGAILAKVPEIPTIRLEHLSETQARAFALAENRLAELSTWDATLLAETLRDLSVEDLDFSLEVTGFSTTDIDLRIEGLEGADDKAADKADAPPDPGPPVSRLGDVWVLDRHALVCGDALRRSTYEQLLGPDRAAVVIADAPYNVPIDGHVGGLGRTKHRSFVMGVGELSKEAFTAFLQDAMGHSASFSEDGALGYWFMDWRHAQEMLSAGEAAYDAYLNLCVWAKTNPGMGSFYRSGHELVFVFKKGRGPHRNNIELGKHGRNRSNVWTCGGPGAFGQGGYEGNLRALHPTVKPVSLLADIMLDASVRGDVVLDPFAGSGSTIISAERVGRICRAIELDPIYVDCAVRRWQAWTGDKARLQSSGRSFGEVGALRAEAGQ